jgi:hypothetical protein
LPLPLTEEVAPGHLHRDLHQQMGTGRRHRQPPARCTPATTTSRPRTPGPTHPAVPATRPPRGGESDRGGLRRAAHCPSPPGAVWRRVWQPHRGERHHPARSSPPTTSPSSSTPSACKTASPDRRPTSPGGLRLPRPLSATAAGHQTPQTRDDRERRLRLAAGPLLPQPLPALSPDRHRCPAPRPRPRRRRRFPGQARPGQVPARCRRPRPAPSPAADSAPQASPPTPVTAAGSSAGQSAAMAPQPRQPAPHQHAG